MTLATALAALVTAAGAHAPADCDKTFTAPMITRAIDAAYHGTRDVTPRDRRHLRRYVRCARRPAIRSRMHAYWHHAIQAWQLRRDPPMLGPVLASYYCRGRRRRMRHRRRPIRLPLRKPVPELRHVDPDVPRLELRRRDDERPRAIRRRPHV